MSVRKHDSHDNEEQHHVLNAAILTMCSQDCQFDSDWQVALTCRLNKHAHGPCASLPALHSSLDAHVYVSVDPLPTAPGVQKQYFHRHLHLSPCQNFALTHQLLKTFFLVFI